MCPNRTLLLLHISIVLLCLKCRNTELLHVKGGAVDCKHVKYSWVYTMSMSSTLNGSSVLQCFEHANVIEICNILISTRECHIGLLCSNRLYSESRVGPSWTTLHKTTTYQLTMCPVTCLSNLLRMLEHHYYIFTTYLLRKNCIIYYVKSSWPEETMF